MPTYLFQHPKTKKVKEVILRMTEPHIFTDEHGVKWGRIWTVPRAIVDGKIDAFSSRDFIEKVGKKKGTMGDLFDQSRELSEKREKVMGRDPVKIADMKAWGKKRDRRHPLLPPDVT